MKLEVIHVTTYSSFFFFFSLEIKIFDTLSSCCDSVWYGAIVRGDVNKIEIGDMTSIGDRAVVHVAKIQGDAPTFIGNNVTIAAGALVHAATLKDRVIVGESAQVLDGCVVESDSVISPGSIVTPGTKVGMGELWAGTPAKKVRSLSAEEKAEISELSLETVKLAQKHAVENAKDYTQILEEEELADIEEHLSESAPREPTYDHEDVLGQGAPGLIFRSTLSHPEESPQMGVRHKVKDKTNFKPN
jgi:carbonic anhydrase/acetyltransferase-like protein (isoleucine patch superfamily)